MSTNLPTLPPGEEWHNPENISPDLLEQGYRFMTKREFETTPRVGVIKTYQDRGHGEWFQPTDATLMASSTYAVPIATWPIPGQAAPESSTPIPAKLDRDIILQAIREIADEIRRWPNDQDVVSHGIAAIQALTKFCDNTRS